MDAFLDLENAAKVSPRSLALLAPGRLPLTYSGIWERVENLRRQFAGALAPGHGVALVLPDGPDFLVALLAAAAFGPCTPLDPAASEDEYRSYFAHLRAPALITLEGSQSPAIAAARSQGMTILPLNSELVSASYGSSGFGSPRATQASLLMFTSSTTGRPKLVPVTSANLEASCANEARVLELTGQDRLLNLTPQFNLRGLRTALMQLTLGGTVVCAPRFELDALPQWLLEFEPTWISVAAPGLAALCALSRQAPGLWRGTRVRFIRSGGTAPELELMKEIETLSGVPVLDGYGTTEAGCVTRSTIVSRRAGSVGRSIGPEIAILDDAGDVLEGFNIPGEIAVRGPNVASGYLDDDEANRRAFRDGWFHTRDLGFLDKEGFLFLTGRVDEVINRGGQKVLPKEVESVLENHPGVKEAAVFGVPHRTLGQEVVAAVVLDSQPVLEIELRRFAADRLTSYKVPRAIMFVDGLPRGATGKVQRKLLSHAYSRLEQESEAPVTATEKVLAAIWEEELRQGPVGRDADFSRMGGDSLTAALVGTRIESTFGLSLDLRAFVEYPRLRDLSRVVDQLRLGRREGLEPLEYAPRNQPLPLSFAQERTWKYGRDSLSYNVAFAHLFRGSLDVDVLRRSMIHLAQTHEMLRTTCELRDGAPVQVVHPAAACELRVADVSGFPEPERQARLMLDQEAVKPFDLARGPLLRFVLARVGPDEHWLLRANHHIISDAHSLKLYFRELGRTYEDLLLGRTPPCERRIEYADYALWQRREWSPEGSACRKAVDWWAERFSRASQAPALPLKRTKLGEPFAPSEGVLSWGLERATSSLLYRLQRAEGVSFYAIRLAAFTALLSEVTGQSEFTVGTHFSYRNRMEWQGIMGDFTNPVTLLLSSGGTLSFREAARAAHRYATEVSAHGEIPYELLCEQLQARGVAPPPIEVMFHSVQQTGPVRMGDVEMTWLGRTAPTMPWGFSIFMDKHNEDRLCYAIFDACLYDPSAVRGFVERFGRLLDAASRQPDQTMGQLLTASR